MSKKRIAFLLVFGVIVATMLVLALNVTAQAQGYGEVGGASTGAASSTGAEVALFAAAGAAMLGAGYFITRKSKA